MKNFSSFITVLLALSFTFSNFTVASQPRVDFNGLWKTGEDVLVNITHSGSSIIVKYVNPGDCATGHNCILGGGAEYYLTGTVSGNKMDLTMMRCTHPQDMRDDGLSDRYATKCKVATVTDKSISGTYRSEYYQFETKDGKRVNFTRDPSGDSDYPFSLTRTNCKEELENLVAEIDRKEGIKKEQSQMVEDVLNNSEIATNAWYDEVKDQLKEEAFQEFVPPAVKVPVVGYTSDDPATFIETWTDFIGDLAEKGGNIAVDKMAKLVLLADLLLDGGNLIGKGVVTIGEVGQMSTELKDMNDLSMANFRSWVNAMIEYRKLSELCAKEIPKDKQPKPKVNTEKITDYDQVHEETNRVTGSINSNIQSAKNELTKTANAIENLHQFLEPHRNAQANRTIKEVLGVTGVKRLQDSLTEIGRNWINVLTQLKSLHENNKKLKELSKPGFE